MIKLNETLNKIQAKTISEKLEAIFEEHIHKQNKKKHDYICNNCKHWGFFGDGLCFTCNYPGKKCPYDKVKIED